MKAKPVNRVETSGPYKFLYGDDITDLMKKMNKISKTEGYRPISGNILFSYGGQGKASSKLSFVIVMTGNLKTNKTKT